MNSADRMDELLTLAIRETVRQEWDAMASADVSEIVKTRGFRRMQKRMTSMIRSGPRKGKPHRAGRRKWLPAVIAACLLLLLLGAPVLAAVSGNTTFEDIMRRLGNKLFDLPYDTPVEMDGITFIRLGSTKTYESLDTFLKSREMHILFPAYLPESVFLDEIHCFEEQGRTEVVLAFRDAALSYDILEAGYDFSTADCFSREVFVIEEVRTEILILEAYNGYQAVFDYEGFQYIICYKSMDELEKILNGLRLR